jgi:hypothetical protein
MRGPDGLGDMRVKKTIWQPLLLGTALGVLAGISTATSLSFLIPAADTEVVIGFFVALFLLAAALGGPLAGAIAPAFWILVTVLFGPPEMQEIVTIPAVFWSNLIALGTVLAFIGFVYRVIYERLSMPVRLLAWAGTVAAFYVIIAPASMIPQYLLIRDFELLPALLFSYRNYVPQVILDIFITSLVLIALPSAYTRPLWYEPRPATGQIG